MKEGLNGDEAQLRELLMMRPEVRLARCGGLKVELIRESVHRRRQSRWSRHRRRRRNWREEETGWLAR